MTWAVAAAVASGLQAVSSIQQGKFQQAQYKIKAKQAELQGRQNALNYSKQAFMSLQKQRKTAATIFASAAAGGVDPFSGSPMTLNQWNAFQAGEEYNLGLENADMAIAGGLAQSQALEAASDYAMKSAYISAASSVAMGAYMYGSLSTPGAGNIVQAGPAGGTMIQGTNPFAVLP